MTLGWQVLDQASAQLIVRREWQRALRGGVTLAFMSALAGVPALLLRYLPADRAVPAYDRAWIAPVLTLQVAGGIVIAFAAQALLAVGLIFYVMPNVGLGLLDLARSVAAFDLPGRILAIF